MVEQWEITAIQDLSLGDQEARVSCRKLGDAQVLVQVLETENGHRSNQWIIKQGSNFDLINKTQIVYLEVNKGILQVTGLQNRYQTRLTLKEALSQLSMDSMIQISKYQALNVNYLLRLELAFSGNMYAHLKTGSRVVVSRRFVKQLKQYLGIQ
ncbi:LytTR family DNA-binding domain-containing protein [Hutsoniella sourekii]